MHLTAAQTLTLVITERVVASISLIAILFILFTYFFFDSFNKPINRMIFLASFGNLGMAIACLISEDGVSAGPRSALCQFQGFFIQMFLGVDTLWACCMAINVYLAFFHIFRAYQLRALDKWYLLFCYGAAFVPAVTFLFIDKKGRGKIYGPAILWCWIDIQWDFLRIALLYGIVWIAILLAVGIYYKAGMVIYRRRDQLGGFLNPLNEDPFTGMVTTSIDITVQQASQSSPVRVNVFDRDFDRVPRQGEYDPYTVNVECGQERRGSKPEILRMRSYTREVAMKETTDTGAWLYARAAFLYFLSMLIIWIPSSINRVYALVYPDRINFGLNFVSALVLPMQGLTNGIVYCITSQSACRELWYSLRGRASTLWRHVGGNHGKHRRLQESESTLNLQNLGGVSDVSVPNEAHIRDV
ncbi:MAG: hypothetical protein Q9201_005638 [Fulgogasparrea decipioides]